MRRRAIEGLFWGSLVLAAGLVLGVWRWILSYGDTVAFVVALVIVLVGTPLLAIAGGLWLAAWQLGIRPRR